MTLQGTLSRVLDAKTRHTIALAVSQANGCDYCLAMHTYVSSELGGMSSDDIDLAGPGARSIPSAPRSPVSPSRWSPAAVR